MTVTLVPRFCKPERCRRADDASAEDDEHACGGPSSALDVRVGDDFDHRPRNHQTGNDHRQPSSDRAWRNSGGRTAFIP